MKKHLYAITVLACCLTAMAACDKDDFELNNLIPEEFHKIVYFQATGKQELTLYNTGEPNIFSYNVMKGGSDPTLTAEADLQILSQEEVDAQYSQLEGVDYQVLETNAYTIDRTHFDFASEERNQTFTVSIDPEAVLQNMNNKPEAIFVLPIHLTSSTDSINANRTSLFLQINEVVSPTIGFTDNNLRLQTFTAGNAGIAAFDVEFGLTVENTSWNIDCNFGVNADYVAEYNGTHGTSFQLLSGGYTFNESASLPQGTTESILSVNIDGTGLEAGDYMLPLAVQSTSVFAPSTESGVCPLGIRIMGDLLDRSKWTTEASSDAQDDEASAEYPNNGSPDAAIDGNENTFWHSRWKDPVPPLPHELIIDTHDTQVFTQFELQRRAGFDYARDGEFYVSDDKSTWTLVGNFTMEQSDSPQVFGITPTQGRYFKVKVVSSNEGKGCVCFAEVFAYGK